ncbi:MAG: type II toxin-antitoxin system VapC family toxin [Kiritimatiellia bacterium]
MKGYLLDTNVISEVRKGSKCDAKVADWVVSVPMMQMYLSVISMMEISSGIFKVLRSQPEFGLKLNDWYENELKSGFAGRVLMVDLGIAEIGARLNHQRSLPYRDGLLAATASRHGFTLVTRNIKDFAQMDLELLNPWVD